MRFAADESIDFPIVTRLRVDGHSVWSVAEMDAGIADEHVLDHANAQQAILLTADKDFGELVFRLKRLHDGIVLVRLAGLPPGRKAEIVARAITKQGEELQGAFSVIAQNTLRIRRHLAQNQVFPKS